MKPTFQNFVENQDYQPSLYDVTRYFKNVRIRGEFRPVVGEEKNSLIVFLAFLMMKRSTIIESYSGGGKTHMLDAVCTLIPSEERYSIELGSEKSPWYDAKEINSKPFVIAPELQKCMQNLEIREILKNWGEGKDAQRKVSLSVFGREDSTKTQILRWHPFISTFALENRDAFIDAELRRRIVTVHTGCSKTQTIEVLNDKLNKSAFPLKMETFSEEEKQKLLLHIFYVIGETDEKKIEFINPFAPLLQPMIPALFTISRSYVDYLLDIINASSLFHLKKRIRYKDRILVAPQDNWYGLKVYGDQFFESCLKIPMLGKEVLKRFPKKISQGEQVLDESYLSVKEVQNKMKEEGVLLEQGKIRTILSILTMSGYLDEKETKERMKYYCIGSLNADWDYNLDWNEAVRKTLEVIRKEYPEIASEYEEKYCKNLEVINPMTGEKFDLATLHNGHKEEGVKTLGGALDTFLEKKNEGTK